MSRYGYIKPRKKKRRTYPFTFHCSLCPGVEIVYAVDPAMAEIKIAGRAWMRDPDRCRHCVVIADQKRTGVLQVAA